MARRYEKKPQVADAIPMVCYCATHKTNGKIYIGVTSQSLDKRKADHAHTAKGGRKSRFSEVIREHGIDAFVWHEIARGAATVMRLVERVLIYEWHTSDPEYGYNEDGGHEGQIRYQLQNPHWWTYGPPWRELEADHPKGNEWTPDFSLFMKIQMGDVVATCEEEKALEYVESLKDLDIGNFMEAEELAKLEGYNPDEQLAKRVDADKRLQEICESVNKDFDVLQRQSKADIAKFRRASEIRDKLQGGAE